MPTYLGLDLSTQSLTAILIDPHRGDLQEFSIEFDRSYPSYGTSAGVCYGDDPTEVYADPRMFIEAVDDMLARLAEKQLTSSVAAIAVSAQQHGSIYLNHAAAARLKRLDARQNLSVQLQGIFSRSIAPVWMDTSTAAECAEITESVGGSQTVLDLTGSIATERFTGPQIRKFWKADPSAYRNTAHIGLISSFVTALLTGHLSPLDAGDGYGMNLADISSACWHDRLTAATTPNLAEKLPQLVNGDDRVGKVSNYMVHRYGFRPGTDVLVGSGDNPCSLVGLGLIGEPRIRAVSLGTSDTVFGYMPALANRTRPEGHIFGAADGYYMFLLCFKNGSLAREAVLNRHALNWHEFSDILIRTPPGNGGRVMLPWFMPEITPRVLQNEVYRFGGLDPQDTEANVRAVIEAQMMAMYLHSDWAGQRPGTIMVTAGGSGNMGILNLMAQVFNARVQAFEVTASAALGAAVRAAHWSENSCGRPVGWQKLVEPFLQSRRAVNIYPAPDAVRIYHEPHGLLAVYGACESYQLGSGPSPEPLIQKFRSTFLS